MEHNGTNLSRKGGKQKTGAGAGFCLIGKVRRGEMVVFRARERAPSTEIGRAGALDERVELNRSSLDYSLPVLAS